MTRQPTSKAPGRDLPARIGPVEFSPFGAKLVAVRCPRELAPLMRRTCGLWEPGSRPGGSSGGELGR